MNAESEGKYLIKKNLGSSRETAESLPLGRFKAAVTSGE